MLKAITDVEETWRIKIKLYSEKNEGTVIPQNKKCSKEMVELKEKFETRRRNGVTSKTNVLKIMLIIQGYPKIYYHSRSVFASFGLVYIACYYFIKIKVNPM